MSESTAGVSDALITGGNVANSSATISRVAMSAAAAAGTAPNTVTSKGFSAADLQAIMGGMKGFSKITSGMNEADAYRAQADFLDFQAEQERIARYRDQQDLEQQKRQTLARQKAALAAQGADTTSGNAGAILSSTGTTFALKNQRLLEDSSVRVGTLKTKAKNYRTAASSSLQSSVFGGLSTGLSSLTDLLK